MKKIGLVILLNVGVTYSQTIYFEDFNGPTHTFTLNAEILWAIPVIGYNHWVVNNVYTGGTYFDDVCPPAVLPFSDTPDQPSDVNGFPNSGYLHITNIDAESQGISNANYVASDNNATCYGNQAYAAVMTNDISTVGYTNVFLSFYWMCNGSANQFGQLLYSTDGGNNWGFLGPVSEFSGENTWTLFNESENFLDNLATVRLGFFFQNYGVDATQHNPGFAIDDFHLYKPNSAIEPEWAKFVNVYPNPVADNFTIDLHENMIDDCSITITNMVGETVYSNIPSHQKITLNKDDLGLRSGIYLVKINYMGRNKVIKLIVK